MKIKRKYDFSGFSFSARFGFTHNEEKKARHLIEQEMFSLVQFTFLFVSVIFARLSLEAPNMTFHKQ